MAEVRPLILELGQKITDRLGRKINENDPEYWGLNEIVTTSLIGKSLLDRYMMTFNEEQAVKVATRYIGNVHIQILL